MYCFQVQHNNCITGILLRALSSEEKKDRRGNRGERILLRALSSEEKKDRRGNRGERILLRALSSVG